MLMNLFSNILEPEPVTSPNQIAIFTRMWHPSTFQLDPFKEIVLDNANVECLKKKVIICHYLSNFFP